MLHPSASLYNTLSMFPSYTTSNFNKHNSNSVPKAIQHPFAKCFITGLLCLTQYRFKFNHPHLIFATSTTRRVLNINSPFHWRFQAYQIALRNATKQLNARGPGRRKGRVSGEFGLTS
ncbi:hypothetical protein CEXT_500481 [Caerostris extrusa]|uniref:Uncharacterized protein n=1 Tax=Caerostris extrusa TaxID=172846 RepID=A0AAV4U833_CAEEX|nr:hypothetical protein CEXT_500481 [Caerostris extrusa]